MLNKQFHMCSAQLCLYNAKLSIMVRCHVVILGCLFIIGYNLYGVKCNIYEVPDSSLITRCHVIARNIDGYNLYDIKCNIYEVPDSSFITSCHVVTRNIDGVPGSLFIVECHVVILECQLFFYSEMPCSNT